MKFGKDRSGPPDVFCKKGVLRNFAKFTGKYLCQSLYFNLVAGLSPKFLRIPFLTEYLQWLLLKQPLSNKHSTKNKVFHKGFIQLIWPNPKGNFNHHCESETFLTEIIKTYNNGESKITKFNFERKKQNLVSRN